MMMIRLRRGRSRGEWGEDAAARGRWKGENPAKGEEPE